MLAGDAAVLPRSDTDTGSDALTGLQRVTAGGIVSPFTYLRRLLADIEPGHAAPIDMTVGEPHEVMPGFVADLLAEAEPLLTRYPIIRCSEDLRRAIANWIELRYPLSGRAIDPLREVHPLNGSREGLFFALLPAIGRKRGVDRPAVLMPNPYFQAYNGATLTMSAEPVYFDVDASTGYLPDLDAVAADEALLKRTAAFY
ncbi:MAG: aspartate aminotransferase, partial [Pseudomonadota bacterium]